MIFKYGGNSINKVEFYYENSTDIIHYLKESKIFLGKDLENYSFFKKDSLTILSGLGKEKDLSNFKLLKTGINIARNNLKKIEIKDIEIDLMNLDDNKVFFILEGMFLEGLYKYSLKKNEKKDKIEINIIIKCKNKKIFDKAFKIAKSRNIVRQLVDIPANILDTNEFSKQIQSILKDKKIGIEVYDKKRLEKENLQGILSVGQGSAQPPYLLKIHYKPQKAKNKITLVGKGVVFDSGGLSLKPSDSMVDMKGDMAGAATVVGAINAAKEMELPVEIFGLIPIVENHISGNSYRVSDVIKYKNGKSVEIGNTDAEGRLILADALIISNVLPSNFIIDLATLTGACMVALGPDIYGVLTNNEKLGRKFTDFVNLNSSDEAWMLPLFDRYKKQLDSKIADVKNIGKRWGGTITAALFLKEFVPKNKDWIHLDIAGPFFDEGLGLFDSMSTGIPLESLVLYLETLI